MDLEDLKKLVGAWYSYNEDIQRGRVNARNLQPREITKVNIKEVFSANTYNLEVREKYNKDRRDFNAAQRKKREA
jgi:hypothetical protein